ncbi:hypothetical protein BDF21DRAFT_135957 [Thamnidium elegans]|nr:hypothetical protein BDF21DRAFT_135957 [Thamnidium elegans]
MYRLQCGVIYSLYVMCFMLLQMLLCVCVVSESFFFFLFLALIVWSPVYIILRVSGGYGPIFLICRSSINCS